MSARPDFKYRLLGDVAILRFPPGFTGDKRSAARQILQRAGVKTVVEWRGTQGRLRVPVVEHLAGDGTETVHKENGCLFKLDVSQVLFSTGNLYERMRIPKLVREGEVVVDMFAGVGQFAIPISKHANPSKVYAIELNPVAYRYLCENVRINRVGHKVIPLLGDCEKVAPLGVADRVIMGLLHLSCVYLPLAMQILKPSGGIIHYHETVPERLRFERPVKRIVEAAGERKVQILEKRVVKKYSPGVFHVVIDARVSPH